MSRAAAAAIRGSIVGGAGNESGAALSVAQNSARIGGSLIGGSGFFSGVYVSSAFVPGFALGGSLVGGSANFTGYLGIQSLAGRISIGGSILGGSLPSSAGADLFLSGFVFAAVVKNMTVGGSVIAGVDESNAFDLRFSGGIASASLGFAAVGGGILGNASNAATLLFGSGSGTTSLKVAGSVIRADILGGYGINQNNNTLAYAGGADAFRIVARESGLLRIGGVARTPAPMQVVLLGFTGDLFARSDVWRRSRRKVWPSHPLVSRTTRPPGRTRARRS